MPIKSQTGSKEMISQKEKMLSEGKVLRTSEKGNSMIPLIMSGQEHELTPVKGWEECEVNDIVYAKVHGRYFTHLVKAKDPLRGFQISNNKGFINGWTKAVFAKVTKVFQQGE